MSKFMATLWPINARVRILTDEHDTKDGRVVYKNKVGQVVGWKEIGPSIDVVHVVHVSPEPIGEGEMRGHGQAAHPSEIDVKASELTDA